MLLPGSPTEVLGATLGDATAAAAAGQKVVARVNELLATLEHLPTRCTLLCVGDRIDNSLLDKFDCGQRVAQEGIFVGFRKDTCW